ncbi:hypothetical protein I552_4641 [Mycobacterium xenopi 3993]|nr:hypothetical protein I552_4641 [Mycobacterium xenopi 3993]
MLMVAIDAPYRLWQPSLTTILRSELTAVKFSFGRMWGMVEA